MNKIIFLITLIISLQLSSQGAGFSASDAKNEFSNKSNYLSLNMNMVSSLSIDGDNSGDPTLSGGAEDFSAEKAGSPCPWCWTVFIGKSLIAEASAVKAAYDCNLNWLCLVGVTSTLNDALQSYRDELRNCCK